jgi:hypothetical protein
VQRKTSVVLERGYFGEGGLSVYRSGILEATTAAKINERTLSGISAMILEPKVAEITLPVWFRIMA